MRFSLKAASFILGAAVAASPVFATAVTGESNIGGNVDVNSVAINFGGTFSVPNTVPPPVETGAFTGLMNNGAGVAGTIGSLNVATTPVGTVLPTPITDFIVFSSGLSTPVMFDLTELAAGFGTAGGCASNMVGNVCTPTGSPFTLIQGPNSVIVDLTLYGDAYTQPKSSGYSPYTVGAFTTQEVVDGGTISGVLGAAATTGVSASYSAQFTATSAVPEPASMLLAGIGLLGAGLVARRKVRS